MNYVNLEPQKIIGAAKTLLRQHEADRNAHVVEGSYTPTITGLPVSSLQFCKYSRIGHFCTVTLYWSCGTPTGADVSITIPFAAAVGSTADIITLGTFSGYRNGGGISFGYVAANGSGTVVKIRKTDGGWFTGSSPQAWASGDIFGCTFTYPTV